MANTLEYSIGILAHGSDGLRGRLERLIVDPNTQAITHLVIKPRKHNAIGRLVPIELATVCNGRIELSLAADEFARLDEAEKVELTSSTGSKPLTLGQVREIEHVYHELELGGSASNIGAPQTSCISIDQVPDGEVEIRRGDHVVATDGTIGHVRGLLMDEDSRQVTHIVLDEGHLWSRKEIAIPISAVIHLIDRGVQLSISKHEVENLPAVPVH